VLHAYQQLLDSGLSVEAAVRAVQSQQVVLHATRMPEALHALAAILAEGSWLEEEEAERVLRQLPPSYEEPESIFRLAIVLATAGCLEKSTASAVLTNLAIVTGRYLPAATEVLCHFSLLAVLTAE
jgi:hypothetical protein